MKDYFDFDHKEQAKLNRRANENIVEARNIMEKEVWIAIWFKVEELGKGIAEEFTYYEFEEFERLRKILLDKDHEEFEELNKKFEKWKGDLTKEKKTG